jgi:tetratricopeptide (TPR) repeat protein
MDKNLCYPASGLVMSDRRTALIGVGCRLALLLTASFGVSAQTSAPELFAAGLTALHHFEYEDANAAFVQARRLDPTFVMAYWGEALTYYQPLWRNENVEAGRQALARLGVTSAARAAAAASAPDRDKELLGTAEILFGDGDATTRHRRYRDAMAGVAAHFPRDADVVSLYALALLGSASRSLIGTSDPQVDGLAGSSLQREVATLLQRVLDAHPHHPGALHYLLHTYDDPAHAAMALPAAKTYASIAGKASHALHMPAHIYLQLGRWHEAAASDRAAYDASVEWADRQHLSTALRNYHALGWLQYELLQLGRYAEARDTIQQLAPVASSTSPAGSHTGTHQPLLSDLSSMRARYVVETRQWQAMAGVTTFGNVNDLFAIGMAAAYGKNIDAARTVRQTLAARKQAPEEGDLRPAIAIMELELAALIARAGGAGSEALDILRAAARDEQALPPPLGLPTPIKPAAELLGEVLLEAGRGRDAYDSFEAVLKRHPNRSLAVLGQARAAVQLGNASLARRHYQQLLQNFSRADANLPEVLEARSAVIVKK